jgi:putative SOS response-associated peptidase YedK
MCGRYTLGASPDDLVDVFDVPPLDFPWEPSWNIAPTQDALIVAADGEGGRKIGPLRWGLVPFWAKDPSLGNKMINARSETVSEKPAFRSAFKKRRCLVPADGFYEWAKTPEGKVPHWIHMPGRRPFAMAGLWERWGGEDQHPLFTFTILTTEAASDIRFIHPRMPVILPEEAWDGWLDPASEPLDLLSLLGPVPPGTLEEWPVSTGVNSPRNDGPELAEPAEGPNRIEREGG